MWRALRWPRSLRWYRFGFSRAAPRSPIATGLVIETCSGNCAVMGKLTSNQVELSNVDLTQQFTDLVIIQRGYQSSSQVISVANQMIQQLVDMRTGGSSGG